MSQPVYQGAQTRESPVQLRDVFPVKIVAIRHPVPEEQAPETPPIAEMTAPAVSARGDQVQVELGLRVAFTPPSQGPFEIEVSIVGVFEKIAELSSGETLDSFVRRNAPQLLLPFLREQVFDLSSRLRMPIMLPVVTPQASMPPRDDSGSSATEPNTREGGARPRPARPPSTRPSSAPPASE